MEEKKIQKLSNGAFSLDFFEVHRSKKSLL